MTAPLPDLPADLDRIRVRFATFRAQRADERTAFAERLAGFPAEERILLDTCHRVELVSVEDGRGAPEAQVRGREAILRVFEVIAGFDSAVVAEEQLLGQARRAYEAALADGSTGPILNELFRRALRFGRRVRSRARPGSDRSLADLGAAWLLERLPAGATIVVVGTGEMGRRLAERIAQAGHLVTVVSTSSDRGRAMLDRLPGHGHSLHVGVLEVRLVAAADAIALAIRARRPAVTIGALAGADDPWVVDLSTPSTVEPEAAARLGPRLLDVDRLSELRPATPVLDPDVERRLRNELDEWVDGFVRWLRTRGQAEALSVLHAEADAVRERHLARLRRRAGLSDDQLAAVNAASAAMFGELLHRPYVALRNGAADADTVRRLFGLDA